MNYTPNEVNLLRRTNHFSAYRAKRNRARIVCRKSGVLAKSRTVGWKTFLELDSYSDATFNAACVLELGLGVFQRKRTA